MGNKYRGQMSANGQVQEVIIAAGYLYTWQEGQNQGIKNGL